MFWNNVKERLDYLGMTQKQLAAEAGLNIGTLKNQICKNVIPDTVSTIKIAKVLNTTVESLVLGTFNKPILLTPSEQTLLDLFRKIPNNLQGIVIELEEKLVLAKIE